MKTPFIAFKAKFNQNAYRKRVTTSGITKAYLEGFRDNSTLAIGRTSVLTLKDPVVDSASLPTGVSQNAGTVTIASPFTGTLSDWDFTDYTVIVSTATGVIFRQCVFGEVSGVPGTYPLSVNVGGQISEIDHCDFIGMGYGSKGQVIVQNSSGTGLSFTAGGLNWIHHCRFEDWVGDCINLSGSTNGQIVEYCYFAPTNNLPYVPPTYNAGTTYAAGDIIKSGAYIFISLVNGNIGNTPPTSKTSNSFWSNYDPHADQITVKAAIDSVTIRRNLFDHTDPPIGATWSNTGVNNILRLSRNTGTDFVVNNVTVEENLMYHANVASLPLALGLEGQYTTGIITFSNNWCDTNGSSLYLNVSDPGADVFTGNKDTTTEADINYLVPDRNRITAITPVGISTTSLNLTFTAAARGGTFYYVVTSSSTRPTNAQIIAGQDHTGSVATASGTRSVTTSGSQTISSITLPSEFVGYAHVAYDRNGRVFTASSSGFSLAAIDYATRTAGNVSYLTGPTFPAGIHSLTFRIRFKAPDGATSAGGFYNVTGNSFFIRHDNRPTKRTFSFLMENSAGVAYTFTTGLHTDLAYTPNTNVEIVCSTTQNRYQENGVEGDYAGIRAYINGVLTHDFYALATGAGTFQQAVQNILASTDTYEIGIRSFERWNNVWLPNGDVSSLGAPDVIIDGNEVLWNGTGLPSGWAKAGANAFV